MNNKVKTSLLGIKSVGVVISTQRKKKAHPFIIKFSPTTKRKSRKLFWNNFPSFFHYSFSFGKICIHLSVRFCKSKFWSVGQLPLPCVRVTCHLNMVFNKFVALALATVSRSRPTIARSRTYLSPIICNDFKHSKGHCSTYSTFLLHVLQLCIPHEQLMEICLSQVLTPQDSLHTPSIALEIRSFFRSMDLHCTAINSYTYTVL